VERAWLAMQYSHGDFENNDGGEPFPAADEARVGKEVIGHRDGRDHPRGCRVAQPSKGSA
jgi:hypothetical protein